MTSVYRLKINQGDLVVFTYNKKPIRRQLVSSNRYNISPKRVLINLNNRDMDMVGSMDKVDMDKVDKGILDMVYMGMDMVDKAKVFDMVSILDNKDIDHNHNVEIHIGFVHLNDLIVYDKP